METQKRPPSSAPHQRANGHVHKDAGFLAPEGPDDHRVAEGGNQKDPQRRCPAGEAEAGTKSQGQQRRGAPYTKTERSSVTLPVPGDSYFGLTL